MRHPLGEFSGESLAALEVFKKRQERQATCTA